jgi:hypothetical protein
MNVLKRIVDLKHWRRSSKAAALIFLAAVVLFLILSAVNPGRDEMMDHASAQVKQIMEEEKDSARKYLPITYNDLGVIKYLSFSTSGAKALKESTWGLRGRSTPRTTGGKFIGQMVNYTYRMLGSGENLLHGVKLTLLLTTLSMLFGFILMRVSRPGQDIGQRGALQNLQRLYLLLPGNAASDPALRGILLLPRVF